MLEQYEYILTPEEVSQILRIGMNRTYDLLKTNQIKPSAKDVFGKYPKSQLLNTLQIGVLLYLIAHNRLSDSFSFIHTVFKWIFIFI